MPRIDQLRTELKSLEALQRRAERLRGKTGRLEFSQETIRDLERDLGHELPVIKKPDGRLTVRIESLVEAIDAKLAE